MCPISRFAAFLALALTAQLALAQATMYKSILPDGRVVYSEKPAAGAVKVEEMKVDTGKKGIVPATPRDIEAARQAGAAQQRGDAATATLRAQEDKVKQAEEALAAGREPQPGERIGIAGGGSRLTDGYFERQKRLEQAVEEAKAELAKARGGR
jgi:hypothetical protein